jgi:hypothetical protein
MAANQSVQEGDVRVQLLSDSLVRLEARGEKGFEERLTFHVVERNWPGVSFQTSTSEDSISIKTRNYTVRVPRNAKNLDGVVVNSPAGEVLYRHDGKLENSKWLPGPTDTPAAWWFADTPRIVPPAWGLTPAPEGSPHPESSGWDLANDAADVYVFVTDRNYRRLRADFLKLTGPTELPPLFAFGAFDSRWFDYTEATALQQIDDYRARKIPLDALVVDTGWRVGASTGYQPNTNFFQDMPHFFREAHARNARVLFNDHPEPVDTNAPALDPRELKFRYDGLSGLLNQGLDVWWYDRNWRVALVTPASHLRKEVWGMRAFHDMTVRARPEQRPLIMANVDGIDNGRRNRPPNVAAHRFSIQWTGDTGPDWNFLRGGVENAVHSGIHSLFAYTSEDLGGHYANPTVEGYIRWIQFGALSPVYRPHCTHNLKRMPWEFGPLAETVARRYLNMRYRLLPVFYAAARQNYETGEPILRRLDLDYPGHSEARANDQYLIGKSILVAPVLEGSLNAVPSAWLTTPQGEPGLQAEYFEGTTPSGEPKVKRVDANIDFNWRGGRPDSKIPGDRFSARWTGQIHVPQSAGEVVLDAISDDGVRVWVDDRLVIDNWGNNDSVRREASVTLKPDQSCRLRVEFMENIGNAVVRLGSRPVNFQPVQRRVWIPPGEWIDAWTGQRFAGPATITNRCSIEQTPVYVKAGSVLALAPEMQFTGEKPWSPVTLDIYPRSGETSETILYEDDTLTTAYKRGEYRKTKISVSANASRKTLSVAIDAAEGNFRSAPAERSWTLRFHQPGDWPANAEISRVRLNGRNAGPVARVERKASAMPFGDESGAPDGDVFEIVVGSRPVASATSVGISFKAK